MRTPENARVFGERVHGARYVERPSVYAIIQYKAREVAVVQTALGNFLPGGGIEPGETEEQAVHREVREECGLAIHLLARLPDAIQLVYSPAELTYFEKTSAFFVAVVTGCVEAPQQEGCQVLWVAPDQASSILAHESHQWACSAASEQLRERDST